MAKSHFQKKDIVKRIDVDKKYSNLNIIGLKYKSPIIYKYMDLEAALFCLKNKVLRFAEPTTWNDPYERRFYTANYSALSYTQPKLYASCFTSGKASEAAWKVYSSGKTGLASRCIQFVLDTEQIRKELNMYAANNGYDLYEGQVNYEVGDCIINHLHCNNAWHKALVPNFNDNTFLSLLLLKRTAFDYEKEIRFFLRPKNSKKIVSSSINISISWDSIIKKVIIEKNKLSFIEKEILSSYVNKACPSCNITIEECSLYTPLKRQIIFQK